MKTFIQSKDSEKDLDDIFDYVAAQNIYAAEKLIGTIFEKLDLLCGQPEMGRSRDEILPGLRSFPVDDAYVVFYRENEETIEISRILHGSRDIPAVFGNSKKRAPPAGTRFFEKIDKN